MRRIVAAVAAVCAVTLAGGQPAQAITGSAAPDSEHPYVGLIALFDATGTHVQQCTGSLLTDKVFLTARHCLRIGDQGTPASAARIWFEQDAATGYDEGSGAPAPSGFPRRGGVTATTLLEYGPQNREPENYDVGLVILDAPVTDAYPGLTGYASLAGAGTLEAYDRGGSVVTVSGYGASDAKGSPPQYAGGGSRLEADTTIVGLNTEQTGPDHAQLAADAGGGACVGDSGGPLLPAGTDAIAAVVSSGLAACRGPFLAYRTDTQPVVDWVLANAGSEAAEIRVVPVAA
jgi:hypothetical protein